MFFSFDGVDGVGKTTQMESFCQWLRDQSYEVVSCRDPGSTKLGEAIRGVLLGRDNTPIHRRSEMLLYMAARAQMVEEIIRPALGTGKIVVSDRFLLANVVYQGYAGGLDVESIRQVGELATGHLVPDLTFVLDMDDELAASRIRREHDRMESQGKEFRRAVRQGYLNEAQLRGHTIVVIDASRDVDVVQAEIRSEAQKVLAEQ
jgi:dTMP kinase